MAEEGSSAFVVLNAFPCRDADTKNGKEKREELNQDGRKAQEESRSIHQKTSMPHNKPKPALSFKSYLKGPVLAITPEITRDG